MRQKTAQLWCAIALLIFTFFYPAVEMAQGFYYGGDVSKAFTNIFSIFIISTLLVLCASNFKTFNRVEILIALTISVSIAMILVKGVFSSGLSYDLNMLIRSLIPAVLVYSASKNLRDEQKLLVIKFASTYIWLTITTLIIFSYLTGIGLHTYLDYEVGSKFYFPSINELTFVYISSWIVLFSTIQTRALTQYGSLLITVIVFYMLGNKSFIALLALFFFLWYLFKLNTGAKIGFLSSAGMLSLILLSTGQLHELFQNLTGALVFLLSNYSSGSEKFLAKLSYLDVTSALISERDMLFVIAKDVFHTHFSTFDFIFGMNLTNYGLAYGELRNGKFSFSENDVVDLFMSYGLTGIILFALLAYNVMFAPSTSHIKKSRTTKSILTLIFLFNGAMTGHIFFFGFTCFVFALYTGLLTQNRTCRSIAEQQLPNVGLIK